MPEAPVDARLAPLFTPLTIKALALRNRIVMSAMTREFSPGGVPGDDIADYYARRAAGGVGLIITEGVGVDHPAAVDKDAIPVMYGEAALAGWRRVVDRVHAHNGLIFPQLWHQGVMREPGVGRAPDVEGCRPSGLWGPADGATALDPEYLATARSATRPMSDEEIADVIAAYERSARFAMDVGFDGVAIHGAHGYLIDTFLWGETNRRDDNWGGDAAGRTRFAVEVVRAIRRAVGPDTPILFRFSQWKQQDFKARLADTGEELARILAPIAEAGVDIFDASTRYFDTPAFEGSTLNLAGWAKRVTGKLAMTVGGVGLDKGMYDTVTRSGAAVDNLPRVSERLAHDEFDLVGVGRMLLQDPMWANKVRRGEPVEAYDAATVARLT